MRRRASLYGMNRAFDRRLRLLQGLAGAVASKDGHDVERAVAFLTIELMTSWANFAREFYLACAFLSPRTSSGQIVSHAVTAITDERQALIHSIFVLKAVTFTKPRIAPRDEPIWHDKGALPKLALNMNLSNSGSIVTGLSYPTSFFDVVPTVRNFYAHRSYGTSAKVDALAQRRFGLMSVKHPSELVNQRFQTRHQTLLQEWLGDLRQISAQLCS